jgi:2-polyprenyl-3-methyl-5-hydroxy-6-metoxy-1,4-benzoquinol methylase
MRPWGETQGPDRLHSSQSVCEECGLVFSNPVCDWDELEAFYRDDYWETHWPEALQRDPARIREAVDSQRPEVRLVVEFGGKGRLLEVGSGTGGLLAAARDEGFEPWGIETSAAAVKHSREVYSLDIVFHGSIPDVRLEPGSFDTLIAWHVIEHVVDLDAFVASMRSLLKQGGLLWIGTENYRNSTHYLDRLISAARGRPAPFSTASEHTMVFNRRTLSDALERRGFEVLMCETYQPGLDEKRKTMRFRNPLSFGYFAMQHAANAVASTGPLMRLAAKKL